MTEHFNFASGTYYLGDLCYVMHKEWTEVCEIIIRGNDCIEGVFELNDGREFGLWNTAYGDGMYLDNIGREYPVDAGLIGIIAVEDIDESEKDNLSLGNVIQFDNSFRVMCSNGLFEFGDVRIDTRDEPESDYDYSDECYNY